MNFQSKIIAIGRMKKNSPFAPAYWEYEKRLKGKIELFELEGRDQKEELAKINNKTSLNAPIISLDETGNTLSSIEFSKKITELQQIKAGKFQFILGGADGLNNTTRERSDFILSFGKLTWPHMLARVMLIEQIYRAQLILSGHPYHREG